MVIRPDPHHTAAAANIVLCYVALDSDLEPGYIYTSVNSIASSVYTSYPSLRREDHKIL